jgi:homoserine O-acetyltransferase
MKEVNSAGSRTGTQMARQIYELREPLLMWHGEVLHRAQIAYETWGELNSAKDNTVLLFTGMSPSAHAASSSADPSEGWWEGIVGPQLAIDTDRFFVVCINSLGSCFGSTGPASDDPATGLPYRLSFPTVSIEDVARAAYETIRSLGIDRIHSLVGPSFGGMAALAFAALHPKRSQRLLIVSSSAAASPYAIAMRSLQREVIMADPLWCNGNYDFEDPPRNGMRLARKLGMLTYRSAEEWQQRFGRDRIAGESGGDDRFARTYTVEGYLEAQAERFVDRFDPNCYLYLSRAIDAFDLANHGASHKEVLSKTGIERALVLGVDSDMLFRVEEQRSLAAACQAAGLDTRVVELQCVQGHDSFLIELEPFGVPMAKFLSAP